MANPQINELVDYIKKAKEAGQTDDQTRQILMKNGWSVTETDEAFAAISSASTPQQPVQQPVQQPQIQQQPQQTQPKINIQPQAQPQIQTQSRPQPQAQPQYQLSEDKKSGVGRFIIISLIILIVLGAIGGGGYFVATQTDLPKIVIDTFFKTPVIIPAIENEAKNTTPAQLNLVTVKLTTVLENYDISKIIVTSVFSNLADKVAYCAPQKVGNKIDCFLNEEKLSNSYSFKPYWIGISPNGKRVVFLYFDSIKKQSFIFENGVEGTRYDGTITSPMFSDDSLGFIYTVMGNNNKSYPVYNGKPGTVHDKIFGIPKLSGDGKYLLYGAKDGQDIFWVADEIK